MAEAAQTNYTEPADAASMLQFLNPKEEIEDILLSMLGLQKKTGKKNGYSYTYVERVTKPVFTDEYSRNLVSDLRSFLNYTVQVSRFDDSDIKRKVGSYLKKLVSSLCTHGDDAYISNQTWQKIVDIHENQIRTKTTAEGDEIEEHCGWLDFGIVWEYDKPVNEEMVMLVKDYDEEKDQAIEFDRIVSKFSGIVHASFNKSFSPSANAAGMLLGSMTQIRTESQIVREAEKKGWLGGGSTFGKE
jgi:hypothetical protein